MSGFSKSIASAAIREVRLHEVSSVAGIHASALPADFFPHLGTTFLEDYYRYSLKLQGEDEAKLFGVFDDEQLIGFCQLAFGSISVLRLINLNVALRMLCLAFLRPGIFINGLIQFFHSEERCESSAEISFIAVDPNCQGNGIGKLLVSKAMIESRKKGITWIVTKTANKDLSSFYQKELKATVISSFTAVGQGYEILKWRARL